MNREFSEYKWFEAQHCGFTDGTGWYTIRRCNTCDEANEAALDHKSANGIPVRVIEIVKTEYVVWQDEINEN